MDEVITTDTLLKLLSAIESIHGNLPVVFKINHDVEYDSYQEKDVGYITDCRRIGKITTEIDPGTLRTDKVIILLDQ